MKHLLFRVFAVVFGVAGISNAVAGGWAELYRTEAWEVYGPQVVDENASATYEARWVRRITEQCFSYISGDLRCPTGKDSTRTQGDFDSSALVMNRTASGTTSDIYVLMLASNVSSSRDTDGDALTDVYELQHGLNPNDYNDVLLDLDGDGVSNWVEFKKGMSPSNIDSDRDGINDGYEVTTLGFNPLNNADALLDFDHDGVSNGAEISTGTNPLIAPVDVHLKDVKIIAGTSWEYGNAVFVDGSRNQYIAGNHYGTADLDPTAGTMNNTAGSTGDAYVTKISVDGTFAWSWRTSGVSSTAQSVVADSAGNTYIAGHFSGSGDFDPSAGTDSRATKGGYDGFVTKISPSGAYLWTKTFGGSAADQVYGVTVDTTGNIYVTGQYFSTNADFDPAGTGVGSKPLVGYANMFVVKLNNNGGYVNSWTAGGTFVYALGRSITVDATGRLYVTGDFQGSVDFAPGTPGGEHATAIYDAFVAAYDSNGYLWSRAVGSSGYSDSGTSIVLDPTGDYIYTAGIFRSTVTFGYGAITESRNSRGDSDAFVTKWDKNGNYVWVRTMGGANADTAKAVGLDNTGALFISGEYISTNADFHPYDTVEDVRATSAVYDIYVTKLFSDGAYGWTQTFAGTGYDYATSLAVDDAGTITIGGYFSGVLDFDPDVPLVQRTAINYDAFMMTLGKNP